MLKRYTHLRTEDLVGRLDTMPVRKKIYGNELVSLQTLVYSSMLKD